MVADLTLEGGLAMAADQPQNPAQPPPPSIPPEELKRAFHAFKKRLKLARLDDESRLGHRAMSTGGKSTIQGIQPPSQYPKAVWEELVRQGKLLYAGQGLYELPK